MIASSIVYYVDSPKNRRHGSSLWCEFPQFVLIKDRPSGLYCDVVVFADSYLPEHHKQGRSSYGESIPTRMFTTRKSKKQYGWKKWNLWNPLVLAQGSNLCFFLRHPTHSSTKRREKRIHGRMSTIRAQKATIKKPGRNDINRPPLSIAPINRWFMSLFTRARVRNCRREGKPTQRRRKRKSRWDINLLGGALAGNKWAWYREW